MTMNKVRRKGSYAPLSAHYYKDDAVDEAGLDAELLYVRGLAFCADVLSDGFISDRQLTRFVGVGMSDVEDRAKALVAVDLWERVEGGYRVRSWLGWNRSKDEIRGIQDKDAARKRAPESERPEPDPPNGPADGSERNPNGIPAESDQHQSGSPNGIPPRAGARAGCTVRNGTERKDTQPPCPTADAVGRERPDIEEHFEEFWDAYPRRIEKIDARKAWRQMRRQGATPEHIISGAHGYAEFVRHERRPTDKIKYPASWLRAGGYDDHQPTRPTLRAVPDHRPIDEIPDDEIDVERLIGPGQFDPIGSAEYDAFSRMGPAQRDTWIAARRREWDAERLVAARAVLARTTRSRSTG
jgi:hypothetical protein